MKSRSRLPRLLALSSQLLALGSLVAAPAPTQPVPDELDLKTAITFAVENNFSIRQARERIRQQDGVVLEVGAKELPSVVASGSYQLNDQELSSSFPASDKQLALSITATHVLYAGGAVQSSVRSSTLAREAAVLELRGIVNDVVLAVRAKFYDILLAREKITVQEKNLELLRSQLQNVSDRYAAGTVSSFEKLRAEVAVANGQVPLIRARNDYRIAIEELRQLLGFATRTAENLRKLPGFVGTLAYVPVSFELQAALTSAHETRPELQRLGRLVAAREESVVVARSGTLPTVALVGGWQYRKSYVGGAGVTDPRDGFLLGVQSSWNVFDGRATGGRVVQARSVVEQARLIVAETTLAIDVEVRRAFSALQEAVELADASVKVVAQAEEAVRLASARFDAGTATQLDVLTSQVALTDARTNQLAAFYAHNLAVARLRKAMGLPDEFIAP